MGGNDKAARCTVLYCAVLRVAGALSSGQGREPVRTRERVRALTKQNRTRYRKEKSQNKIWHRVIQGGGGRGGWSMLFKVLGKDAVLWFAEL